MLPLSLLLDAPIVSFFSYHIHKIFRTSPLTLEEVSYHLWYQFEIPKLPRVHKVGCPHHPGYPPQPHQPFMALLQSSGLPSIIKC